MARGGGLQRVELDVQNWTQLQVCDLSDNRLELAPPALGWLPLTRLNLDNNPELRIPAAVQQLGFNAG
ncbi:uncharacterized protein HaLaN_11832 [Haematococcus lacustris]|uniref:Uncharacterized protein n=1 Tax=Haematococcus lacustris TaxID=44745 RepID=A0A699ZIR0_HAELA|nr:uncharacterized protein HaLaN_11832 [Haematococcus lacustris]